MTVAELIEKLKELPQDAMVIVIDDGEVEQFIEPCPRLCDFGAYNLYGPKPQNIRDGVGNKGKTYFRL